MKTEDANRAVTAPRAAGTSWVAQVWKVEWEPAAPAAAATAMASSTRQLAAYPGLS